MCIIHGSGIFREYKCEDKEDPWILCIREIDNTNHGKARHGPGICSPGQKIEKQANLM
jgi:hypothetical protein